MYLPLPPPLDDLGDAIGERSLALTAQHAFERHPGGTGNRVVPVLPAPDIAITSARAISPVDSPSALRQRWKRAASAIGSIQCSSESAL